MEYKQQERQFSTRPAIDPAKYTCNKGARSDGFTDFDTMFCPWCEDWVTTIKSQQEELNLETVLTYILCCVCTLMEAICCPAGSGGDVYHDCSRCNRRLTTRKAYSTVYYLPAGDGTIAVEGGRNEVIALAHRSTAQSIEYAHRAADIYAALWLSYYQDHGLWVHNQSERTGSATQSRWNFTFLIWAKELWEKNFRDEGFSTDEMHARVTDAQYIFSEFQPKPSTHPAFWKEVNSPWIWQAAKFLNKELGPGPELCKAWKSLLADYNSRKGNVMHFIGLYRVNMRDIEMPTLKTGLVCKYPDECVCRRNPDPEDLDEEYWEIVMQACKKERTQRVKLV